jgi:epoxyqueuosine reductase
LGWFGKNTCLINREKGSYFFLGEILTDITLPPDLKETDHCGTCSRCLEACPTQAFPQPYVLDSNKCISYWTIEHRGTIPDEIKTKIQGHLFGCDVCQEVCPWNDGSHKNKKKQNGFHLDPSFSSIESTTQTLTRIFQTSEVEFNKNFEGRPLKRSKWQGLVRNAAIVIGNLKLKNFKNDLESVLPKNQKDHPELTEEIKWALEKLK